MRSAQHRDHRTRYCCKQGREITSQSHAQPVYSNRNLRGYVVVLFKHHRPTCTQPANKNFVAIHPIFYDTSVAQQSARFDQFELHRSVVYTTFLSPEVATQYRYLSRYEIKQF